LVAPSAIGGYIAGQLHELGVPARVQQLKGTELRLHEEGKAALEPGVYFVSNELTRRPWVRDVLASLPWSLACVDEAHYGGRATSKLVARLAQSEMTRRVCAASATWSPNLPGFDVVTWAAEPARRVRRRVTVIQYERSEEERQVRDRLAHIEGEFGADSLARASFDSAWRSSTSSFEFVLARHAALLESLKADAKSSADPTVRARTGQLTGESPHARWSDPDGAARALKELLHLVGAIGRDSKLEAFRAHVGQRGADSKIAVFTAMRQTAIYLAAALDVPTSVIDGARAPIGGIPTAEARVVIITDAVLPAVDLSSGFEGVSYDLPFDPMRMEARWANLGASTGEAIMAWLEDASHVDRVEHDVARKLQLIQDVLGDLDPIFGAEEADEA
jgi:hypothetical protein